MVTKASDSRPPRELLSGMESPVPGLSIQLDRRERVVTGFLFERHWHDHLQLMRVRRGRLRMSCRSGLVDADPGDVLVFGPGELHFSPPDPDPASFDIVKLGFPFLESAGADACQLRYMEPLRSGRLLLRNRVRDPAVRALVDAMGRAWRAAPSGLELLLKGLSFQLLAVLVRDHLEAELGEAEAARRERQRERLGAALARLEEGFREDVSLPELSRLSGLCESRFCRVFKALTGRSPLEHRNLLRVRAARELLAGTSRPIESIAFECGFSDPNYFSRVFRRFEGVSPSDSRRSRR